MAGRARSADGCLRMPWSRLHNWKVPSVLEILGCYSVRSRWCIWLNVVFEGKAASDDWEAGKLVSSLTLGDLAPGFSCMRLAGFASDRRRRCEGFACNLSNRVKGVQEARAVQGAPIAQQHHLDLEGPTALRSDGSSQSSGSFSCCPAPVLREAPRISCLERMLISCKGSRALNPSAEPTEVSVKTGFGRWLVWCYPPWKGCPHVSGALEPARTGPGEGIMSICRNLVSWLLNTAII